MSLGVVLAVAIGHKIQKDIQVFQTQRRLLFGDFLAGVGGIVAHAADQVHPPPDVCAHDVPEVLGIHQTDQRVLIRHDQRLVHGVHPLHGKLHRPAAVQHAGGRVDGQNALGGDGNRGEGGKLWGGEECVKVGHGMHLLYAIVYCSISYPFSSYILAILLG